MEKPRYVDTLRPEIREAYKTAFGSESGKIVIRDLERIANRTAIDNADPNPYSAIYKEAQRALMARIYNVLGKRLDEDE